MAAISNVIYAFVILVVLATSHFTSSLSIPDCDTSATAYCLTRNNGFCEANIYYPYACAIQPALDCRAELGWSIDSKSGRIAFQLDASNVKSGEWVGLMLSPNGPSLESSSYLFAKIRKDGSTSVYRGSYSNSKVVLRPSFSAESAIEWSQESLKLKTSLQLDSSIANSCQDDSEGTSVFLMSGQLASDGSISLANIDTPTALGPFCFNKCKSSAVGSRKKRQVILLNRTSAEKTSSESDSSIGAVIDIIQVSNQLKQVPLIETSQISLRQGATSVIQSSTNDTTSASTPTTAASSSSITSATTASATSGSNNLNSTSSTLTTPSTTTHINTTQTVTTSAATTASSSTTLTTTSSTSAATTVAATTTQPTTTTSPFPASACLKQQTLFSSNSSTTLITFQNYYDNQTDNLNYQLTVNDNKLPLNIAIYIAADVQILALVGKVDSKNVLLEPSASIKNSSSKLTWNGAQNQSVLSFSIARQSVFNSYGANMRDCYSFIIFIGENSNVNMSEFAKSISSYANYSLQTQQICSDACGYIAKTPVSVYISMNIDDVNWSPNDQAFLNTSNALSLIRTVTDIIKGSLIGNKFFYTFGNLTVLSIKSYNSPGPGAGSRRHRRAPPNNNRVWFNSIATMLSSNSPDFTTTNLNTILSTGFARSSQLDVSGVTTSTSPASDPTQTGTNTSTDQTTTTINPNTDPNYSRNLAIALIVSLVIVVAILVAGLIGFSYWKKKRFSGDTYASATPSNRGNNNPLTNMRASRTRANNMVKLENTQPNNYTDDEFELNYSNPAFLNDHQDFNGQYTDFTGSREVGIDIGPIDEDIGYTNPGPNDYQFNPQAARNPIGQAKISLNPSVSPEVSKHQPYNVVTSTTNNSTTTNAGFLPSSNGHELSPSSKKYIKSDSPVTPDDDDEFNMLDELVAKSNLARFKNSENLFAEPAESPINKHYRSANRNDSANSSKRSLGSNNLDMDKRNMNVDDEELSKEDFSNIINQRFSDILNDKDLKDILDKNDSKKPNAGFYNSSLFNDKNQVIAEENENESDTETEVNSNSNEVVDEEAETELKDIFKKDLDQNILESLNTFGFDPVDHMIKSSGLEASNDPLDLTKAIVDKSGSLKRKNTGGKKSQKGSSLPRANAPLGFSSNESFEPDHDSDMSSVEIDVDLNKKKRDPFEEMQLDSENLDDISVDIPDDDGFKEIDSNALKNLKLQSNNFILASDSLPTIKDLIVTTNSNKNKGNNKLAKSSSMDLDDESSLQNSANVYANKIIEGAISRSQDNILRETFDFEIPKPRICVIKPSLQFDGLGIHLFNNKEHMIKEIEPNSPAELSGLKPGDKIIGVDNQDVTEKDNSVVVELLKNALATRSNIELTVMNTVEWNIFNKYAKTNLSTDSLQTISGQVDVEKENIKNDFLKTSGTFDSAKQVDPFAEYDIHKDLMDNSIASDSNDDGHQLNDNTQEFNPFQDVPSETHSPFLHYSSILPPTDFQAGILNENETSNNNAREPQQSSPLQYDFIADTILNRSKALNGDEDDESSFGSELKRINNNRQANNNNTFTLMKNDNSFLKNLNESSTDTKIDSANDFDQNFVDLLQFNNPNDPKGMLFDPSPFEISPKSKDTSLTSSSSSTTSTSSNPNEFYLNNNLVTNFKKPNTTEASTKSQQQQAKGVKNDFSIWNASASESEPSLFP